VIKEPGSEKKKGKPPQSFARYTAQVAKTVLQGIKMSGMDIHDPFINPTKLVEVLKMAGPSSLAWKPETLYSYLDKNYSGWSSEKIANALEHFHATGELQTDIPTLVRQKLHSIRIVLTSDTAHREWHIFEKVGCVFSNRLADFRTIEPLSPLECAVTVALIDSMRPDRFSDEVAAYVAASCHMTGIYTIAPCKWLNFAESYLQKMNEASTGRPYSSSIGEQISSRLSVVQKADYILEETFSDIQALKLLALNVAGDSALGV
jgi:hypothetical protein